MREAASFLIALTYKLCLIMHHQPCAIRSFTDVQVFSVLIGNLRLYLMIVIQSTYFSQKSVFLLICATCNQGNKRNACGIDICVGVIQDIHGHFNVL